MSTLHQIIENHWQHPRWWLTFLLKPLSLIFQASSSIRRLFYRRRWLQSHRLPVPVVIVGNIHAGGVGKTPIVASLVKQLQQQGIFVGIISRGYGRDSTQTHVLTPQSQATEAGDEPLMLYRQTNAPTAVGRSRLEAGKALLNAYPDLALIICDDGLQHYALKRDMEIAVFPYSDTSRTHLDCLPNGALREPIERLAQTDALMISSTPDDFVAPSELFDMPSENIFSAHIALGDVYRLNMPSEKLNAHHLENRSIGAMAAIARPERFFNSLKTLNIPVQQTITLPDHAKLDERDFPPTDIVILTEKDASKLTSSPATEKVWVLPIYAIIRPDLAHRVIERCRLKPSNA